MCNINVFIRKNGKDDLRSVINATTFNSYLKNDDGEGYFEIKDGEVTMDKSFEKINFMNDVDFLVTHQRLATTGDGINNVHPHESKDFIMVHNGIFYGIGNHKESDSIKFLQELQKEYDTENDLLKSVENAVLANSGYYSIVLYHKESGRTYYFKNNTASMYYVSDENYLIMSTVKENVEYSINFLGLDGFIYSPVNLKLYDITDGYMNEVGSFQEYKYLNRGHVNQKHNYCGHGGSGYYNGYNGYNGYDDYSDTYCDRDDYFVKKNKKAYVKNSLNFSTKIIPDKTNSINWTISNWERYCQIKQMLEYINISDASDKNNSLFGVKTVERFEKHQSLLYEDYEDELDDWECEEDESELSEEDLIMEITGIEKW